MRAVTQRVRRVFGLRTSRGKVPVARLRLDGPIMPPQGGGGMSRGRITVPDIEKQVRATRSFDDFLVVLMLKELRRQHRWNEYKAIALSINSPGGAAAQSALVCELLQDVQKELGVPMYAFAECAVGMMLYRLKMRRFHVLVYDYHSLVGAGRGRDVCASGGYMLACAADEIYINPFTVIGSVGVLSASFGFKQVIERWGIERRLQTAGSFRQLKILSWAALVPTAGTAMRFSGVCGAHNFMNAGQRKILTDPFGDWTPEGKEVTSKILMEMHDRFKEMVRTSRGDRLGGAYLHDGSECDVSPPQKELYKTVDDLLEGDVFVGKHAVGYGFADGIGSLGPTVAEKLQTKQANLDIQDIRKGGFSLFSWPMGASMGSAAGDAAAAHVCTWLEDQSLGKQSFR